MLGIACAVGAVGLGLVHLAASGAPIRYLGIQSGALVAGLLILWGLHHVPWSARFVPALAAIAMAGALLATALLGASLDGVTRWVRLGSLLVQPSFVFLPVLILCFARRRGRAELLAVAGAALALQPDRAMAAMLAASTILILALRPERLTLVATLAAAAGCAVALSQADTVPPAPFVERVYAAAWASGGVAGFAVLAGSLLLLVPAVPLIAGGPEDRLLGASFGLVWLSAIAAAMLGDYPTPVVGYGGSAVLGYVLSLAALPRRTGVPADASRIGREKAPAEDSRAGHRRTWRHGLAG
ncbi:hypothetical protein DD559_01660 [Sphingomonas pokkalii]|uniref:Cell wall polymerase n=2 Tax=Sphingomonas pokkalii TaxID=2175090 RepID=A0A2U0S9Z3_9SPHN|nr:hypothetical protein DD559_01660 [Sphingomonas pokkalii]